MRLLLLLLRREARLTCLTHLFHTLSLDVVNITMELPFNDKVVQRVFNSARSGAE